MEKKASRVHTSVYSFGEAMMPSVFFPLCAIMFLHMVKASKSSFLFSWLCIMHKLIR